MADERDIAMVIGAAVLAAILLYHLALAVAGHVLGLAVVKLVFGYGDGFKLFSLGRTQVRLSPFLVGGSVAYGAPLLGEGARAPGLTRAVAALAGPLCLIITAGAVLGPRGLVEAGLAFPQMWRVVADWSAPVDLLSALGPVIAQQGHVAAGGVVLAKIGAFTLLPTAVTAGGAALLALVDAFGGKAVTLRIQQALLIPSLILLGAFLAVFAGRAVWGAWA